MFPNTSCVWWKRSPDPKNTLNFSINWKCTLVLTLGYLLFNHLLLKESYNSDCHLQWLAIGKQASIVCKIISNLWEWQKKGTFVINAFHHRALTATGEKRKESIFRVGVHRISVLYLSPPKMPSFILFTKKIHKNTETKKPTTQSHK